MIVMDKMVLEDVKGLVGMVALVQAGSSGEGWSQQHRTAHKMILCIRPFSDQE